MEITVLDEELAFSDLPRFRDLREINKHGLGRHFRTLVSVLRPEEQAEPEAIRVERIGLRLVEIPILEHRWSEEPFELLFDVLADPKALPVLVHGAYGERPGILALTCFAATHGLSSDELVTAAGTLGLELPAAAFSFLEKHHRPHAGHRPLNRTADGHIKFPQVRVPPWKLRTLHAP
ncbi:MAG: hypothetical protein HY698_21765 [Deltaproteobacteria bacterium]|nr:hypothetical protein [Deltaproteobacteria bacterium]